MRRTQANTLGSAPEIPKPTAILGIVMALKLKRSTWFAWTCLIAGAVLPVLLAVAARR